MKHIPVVILFLVSFVSLFSITESQPPIYGDGSLESPYQLTSLENLRWLSESEAVWGDSLNLTYFDQVADIDASDTYSWNDGLGFQPIGYTKSIDGSSELDRKYFYGEYNGNDYKITNLYINTSQSNYKTTGMFGLVENATVCNLIIEDATIIGNSIVATIIGTGGNSTISKCSVTSNISGNESVSSIAGIIANSELTQLASNSVINANTSAGGLVGLLNHSNLSNSFFAGEINVTDSKTTQLFGGLVLNLFTSNMMNCYSNTLINSSLAGGLIGMGMNSTVDASVFNSDLFTSSSLIVTNINTSINSSSGLSTSALTNLQTYIELDWDFDNVWTLDVNVNESLPYLQWLPISTSLNDDEVTAVMDNKLNIYPNPFNPTTTIEFKTDLEEIVVLEIYNIKGQKVRTLINGELTAQKHKVVWNGKTDNGKRVASGLYFARLTSSSKNLTSKLMVIK